MSALGIGLAWMALATVAFLVLSASALARTHRELEADPWIPGENPWTHGEAHPRVAHSRKAHPARPQALFAMAGNFATSGRAQGPASPAVSPAVASPAGARALGTRPHTTAPQPRLGVARRERRGALADASW
jgi:hypothetical protein